MARSRLWSRSRGTRRWAALALLALGPGLEAAPHGPAERLVEVRAGERVLARAALLIERPPAGAPAPGRLGAEAPLLRVRDLAGPWPAGLPHLAPVRHGGELYWPLGRIAAHVRLDQPPGVLEVVSDDMPNTLAALKGPPAKAPGSAVIPAAFAVLGAAEPAPPAPLPAPPAAPPAAPNVGPAPNEPPPAPAIAPAQLPPEPGAVRRRDPLEAPLLEQDAWQEWLVAVVVNGETVSEGALMIQAPDGRWAARVLDLRAWRVRLDENAIITFNGEAFYPLDALPDAQQVLDGSTLTLELTLPAEQFEGTAVALGRPSTIAPQAGRGAFFDYDLLYLTGDGVRERLDALLEVGAFDRVGVMISGFRAGDVAAGERDFVRLDTTFTKDLPAQRASLRLGDSLTAGGVLGRPARFGGVQFASNFATDPAFVTFPLPSIGGLAQQSSVAEIYLDNTRRITQEVPAGPFEIDNLPVVTGAGEVQLRVTDLLGREQLVTQSFYISPRLLRAGLSEYSYEAGLEREGYNEASFDYGKPLAVATHRYGLTDGLTGEGHAEAGLDRQALGLSSSVLLGNLGLLSGGLTGSLDQDHGAGFDGFLDYEYRASLFSVGLRSRYASAGFRQIGLDDTPDARTDQASLGFSLGPLGRVGTFVVHTKGRDREDRLSASANYSIPLGPGSFLLNALQSLRPDRELALLASYSMPISPIRSLTSSSSYRGGEQSSRVEYRRGRGSTDLGPSYRLATEFGEDPRVLDASMRYDAPLASGQVDVARFDGDNRARANLTGSVANVDGEMGMTRRLGRAFGIVDLPGYPDVTVYLENREVGRTDADGTLLLPRLNPYQANRIRVRAEDLPLTAELKSEELIAVPFDRSGVRLAFAIKDQRTALATLVDGAGKPLPAGLELVSADGHVLAQVADRGLAYVRDAGEGGAGDAALLVSVPGQPAFRCPLPPLPAEPMAQLGQITCR